MYILSFDHMTECMLRRGLKGIAFFFSPPRLTDMSSIPRHPHSSQTSLLFCYYTEAALPTVSRRNALASDCGRESQP